MSGFEGTSHAQFSARNVREALGLGSDEPYSLMCERSHPRPAAAQLAGWMTTSGDGILLTGGLPLEHSQVRSSGLVLAALTPKVAVTAGRVTVRREAAGQFPTMVSNVIELLQPGVEETFASLEPAGRSVEIAEDALAAIQRALDASRDLERVAAERQES